MARHQSVLVAVVMIASYSSVAQLKDADTARWDINASISGRLNTGNVERFLLTPECNVLHVADHGAIGFSSGQRYTRADGFFVYVDANECNAESFRSR